MMSDTGDGLGLDGSVYLTRYLLLADVMWFSGGCRCAAALRAASEVQQAAFKDYLGGSAPVAAMKSRLSADTNLPGQDRAGDG